MRILLLAFLTIIFLNSTKAQYIMGADGTFLENDKTVNLISQKIYELTGFKIYINMVLNTPLNDELKNRNDLTLKDRFYARREYEKNLIKKLNSPYAIIFLYYNEHHITVISSESFIDSKYLLEEYAYPYLPISKVGSYKYDEGIKQGLSNIYLALVREVKNHYDISFDSPNPLEKPKEILKAIIYIMLFSLVGLFLLVRFGILARFMKK